MYAIWLLVASSITSKFLGLPITLLMRGKELSVIMRIIDFGHWLMSLVILGELLTILMPINIVILDDAIIIKSLLRKRKIEFSSIIDTKPIGIKNIYGEHTYTIKYLYYKKRRTILLNQSEYRTTIKVIDITESKISAGE